MKNHISLIHHFLENSADIYSNKPAIIYESESYTYARIEEMSNQVANLLSECGIKKGDRCAILLRNSIKYVISYYGVLKTGAIVVPINTGIDEREISTIFNDCLPRVLITDGFFTERIKGLLNNKLTVDFLITFDDMQALANKKTCIINLDTTLGSLSCTKTERNLSVFDIATIVYTSGSTGKPKGVVLMHSNIVSNTISIVSYLKLNKDDRIMVILPFYYVYGKSLLNTHFLVGGSVVIDNRFIFPNVVLKSMVENEATGFAGVPSTYSILLNRSNIRKISFPHLRYLTQAGGHMPRSIKEELMRIFYDKEIFIMYGATEASARLSYLEPHKLNEKIDSIGKAIPGVEMALIKEDGNFSRVGEEGEIVARGPNIMIGYWDNPTESEKALKDGWYHTGDLAIQDEDGYFYIVGRKKDIIKTGIHKVSAKEVEDVIYSHEKIDEVAVVGIQDEVLGESIKAYIVAKNGQDCSAEEIISYCANKLPDFKIPKQIVFVKDLPKNEAGKVLKHKLNNNLC